MSTGHVGMIRAQCRTVLGVCLRPRNRFRVRQGCLRFCLSCCNACRIGMLKVLLILSQRDHSGTLRLLPKSRTCTHQASQANPLRLRKSPDQTTVPVPYVCLGSQQQLGEHRSPSARLLQGLQDLKEGSGLLSI